MAALEIVSALFQRRVSLNFGVAGLWIGPGLIRLRESAREWAVRLNLLGVAFAIVVIGLFASGPTGVSITVMGKATNVTISYWWAMLGTAALALLAAWKAWYLQRPDVRAVFTVAGEKEPRDPHTAG